MTTVTITEQRIDVSVAESAVLLTLAPVSVAVSVAPGATSFLGLSDTPLAYATHGSKAVAVKSDASGLEFVAFSGGVTDHGALTGLADDDHTQYHTDARGDARYWALSTDLATQAELDTHTNLTTTAHGGIVPSARTLTINGTALDLSADRAWTVGAGSVTSVDITAPAAGITAAGGPITSSGSITLALANDLAALEGLGSTGIAVRSASDTWLQRTITGTSNRLDVTNGNGVAGNPTLDISSSYVGQASITTLGTIATGTWQGTAVAAGYGGTGLTSYAVGDLVYADGAASLTKLADVATGNALISGGVTTAPAWGKIGLTTHISGTLAAANGGTGIANGASATLTLPNAATTITTGGTLALGGFTLTVPATGTAALKEIDNVFATGQGIRVAIGSNASGLYVPWVSGDTQATATFGADNASNNAAAVVAQSGSGNGITVTTRGGTGMQVTSTSALTVSQTTIFDFRHNSSGTPGTNFGMLIAMKAKSSTTNSQDLANFRVIWATATHASRKARMTINVNDASNEREGVRVETDGARANVGLLGGGSFGSGSGVLFLADATTAPTANATGGSLLYAVSGLTTVRSGLSVLLANATTNAVDTVATLTHDSTGTPAAGFGGALRFAGMSATVDDRSFATWDALWATATDASRKARIIGNVYDTAAREWVRGEASGSAAMIGFLGAGAIVRQTVAADATDLATAITLVNDIKAKLSAAASGFGLFT